MGTSHLFVKYKYWGLGSNGTVNALKRSKFTSDNNLKYYK
jgi:hypothetical protein